ALTEDGDTAEVGVTGFEGVIGIQSVLGGLDNTFDFLVQLAGDAWKIKSEVLRQEFRKDNKLQENVLRYLHASFAQISQTALCNAGLRSCTRRRSTQYPVVSSCGGRPRGGDFFTGLARSLPPTSLAIFFNGR